MRLHKSFRNRAEKQKRAALNPNAKKKKAKHETLLNEVQEDVLQHEPVQEPIVSRPCPVVCAQGLALTCLTVAYSWAVNANW
jgi:hypothetical protein